jgi:hypothetical protein
VARDFLVGTKGGERGLCSAVRKNTWGMRNMSPTELSATFRLYGAYCLETAGELVNPNRKAAILHVAQAWLALAETVEKNNGLVLGVSLLPLQPNT